MSLIVNRRDLDFLLYEVGNLSKILLDPKYEDFDRASINAVLDTAQSIAEDKYLPCAAKLDANEPTFDGETVSIIPEVGEALSAYAEAGFFAAGFDQDLGGMGLPVMACQAAYLPFNTANCPLNNYAFLTIAAANMLAEFGSEALISRFLPSMIEGRWFGTMCLSEPQAGSSLSDIRTKAEPTDAGDYLITGSKMWISGGEQEISENIIHMVLAKIPGGPPGVKGISLFLVPKYRVNEDGTIGDRNDVNLAGLNHKMGHRGTTNTLLNFGESGECRGYLIGEPHKGLSYMFHMMNEARVGVGMGAALSGLAGFLYSLDYARNRPQGRHAQNKDPETQQVMIIEHADIKRLLLAQKASVEGALSLLFYCAELLDLQKIETDESRLNEISLLLDILTPIAKSWPSEFCLEANKHAIQILGGYGYTREYPVERFYRDNRLNHIHEGTHGIQGLDLLGRKVRMKDGAALACLVARIHETIDQATNSESLSELADQLAGAVASLQFATSTVLAETDVNRQLANATVYLDAFGHIVVAWIWLRQALVAQEKLEAGSQESSFYKGKLLACRYFFQYELPQSEHWLRIAEEMLPTCLDASADHFLGQ